MQLSSRASLAFKKEKPPVKVTFGNNVVNSLTPPATSAKGVKAMYPDIPIPVASLQQLNDALALAIADSLTGNHSAIAAVKDAVYEWDNAFGTTANYITSMADGSEATIRAAGYVPTKSESQPAQKPGAATNFKATINGMKGAIIAGAKKAVPEAAAYVYAAFPEEAVVTYNSNTMIITIGGKSIYISADTRKQTELYNLPSGVPHNVTMFAINSAGTGPASAVQQVIPQ